ncbi:MAG: mycothiol system anti-sigma-R factor [Nitriliruptorales bacterium]|nr:mycothiol system anti-sigma-R factor [Nitriliruptorales bacterium]
MTGANDDHAAAGETDCHAALKDLQFFLDGECGAAVQRLIIQHLHDCPPCEHRADFERELRVFIAMKCKDVAPSGLLDRIRVMLQQIE